MHMDSSSAFLGKHRDLQPFGLLRLSVAKNLILNKRGLLINVYIYIYVFIRTCAYIQFYIHPYVVDIEVCQKNKVVKMYQGFFL